MIKSLIIVHSDKTPGRILEYGRRPFPGILECAYERYTR